MKGTGSECSFCGILNGRRLLVHLVDVSDFTGRDPASDFDVILPSLRASARSFREADDCRCK